jgi:hypothetical protein
MLFAALSSHAQILNQSPLHSLNFGDVLIGQSESWSVILTNNSGGPVEISSIQLPLSPFTSGFDTCAGQTLPNGGACQIAVLFTPTSTGLHTASISVTFISPSGTPPQSITLYGTGVTTPPLLIQGPPSPVEFRDRFFPTVLGGAQAVYLHNPSSTTAVQTGTQFSVVEDHCSNTVIAPGGDCMIVVEFSQTVLGPDAGDLSLPITSPTAVTHTFTVQGAMVPYTISLDHSSLDFGDVQVGQSADLTVTMSNAPGATPVAFDSLWGLTSVTGTSFSVVSDNCPGLLAGGASCTVTVRFKPTATGSGTENMELRFESPYGFQKVKLQGNGVAAAIAAVPALNLYPLLALAALLFALGCWQSGLRKR